jgi:hypothetical protein
MVDRPDDAGPAISLTAPRGIPPKVLPNNLGSFRRTEVAGKTPEIEFAKADIRLMFAYADVGVNPFFG